MTLKDDIIQARRTHDIADVLGTTKPSILCPLPMHQHRNNTPSFSVYWLKGFQWWKCHGNCGVEGDIVDLVGYLRIPGYNPKDPGMINRALALLDERYELKIVLPQKTVTLNGSEWMDFVPPGIEVIEYARGRGIEYPTLNKFRVGQSGTAMTMPCFHDGLLRGIKFRSTTKKMYWSMEGSRQGLFNFDAVNLNTGVIFVMKAEIPAMIMDQEGFITCAPTGGEGGWIESWRTALALGKKIVVRDNDEPGQRLGERRAALLGAEVRDPPAQFKDWDAWCLQDRNDCLTVTKRWQEEARSHA